MKVVLTKNSKKQATKDIQQAIDKVHENGGGVVVISAGKYEIGTIYLKSFVELYLEDGAVLYGSAKIKDYGHSTLRSRFANDAGNVEMEWYYSLIVAEKCESIGITGNGIIDGRGEYGKFFPNGDDPYKTRPFLINLYECNNVKISGVSLKNSGMYAIFSQNSTRVRVSGVTIDTLNSVNGDGIDFDGGEDLIVSDCFLKTGDDAISPKACAGSPVKNLVVTNCVISSRWSGIRLGVESSCDMNNITISNCVFDKCYDGIKIQECGPGIYENISVSNCTMKDVVRPFFITLNNFKMSYADGSAIPAHGKIRNISISGMNIVMPENDYKHFGAERDKYFVAGSVVSGTYLNKIENVRISDITIVLREEFKERPNYAALEFADVFEQYPEASHFDGALPACVFFLRHIDGLYISNVGISLTAEDTRPYVFADDVNGVISFVYSNGNNILLKENDSKLTVFGCTEKIENLAPAEVSRIEEMRAAAKQYREEAAFFAHYLDICEEKKSCFCIEAKEAKTSENVYSFKLKKGKYYIRIPKTNGDCVITADGKTVYEHRLNDYYRLSVSLCVPAEVEKDSSVCIEFLNGIGVGHRGPVGEYPVPPGIEGSIFCYEE